MAILEGFIQQRNAGKELISGRCQERGSQFGIRGGREGCTDMTFVQKQEEQFVIAVT
jgi:hypothetical protein